MGVKVEEGQMREGQHVEMGRGGMGGVW